MSMMGGGGGPLLSGLRKDRSVVRESLPKGLVRRVAGYGRPYRGLILGFLVVLAASSAVGVVPPLLLQRIIDRGVIGGDQRLVITLAIVVAVIAFVDAALNLVGRWCSSHLGESLIRDLRTQVFAHVQSMPLAFFTRAQTGKLVSRLNTDVIGAQQAFTSTLTNSVANILTVGLTLAAMFTLSIRLTIAALVIVPIFLIPAKIMGARLAELTRQQMNLNAEVSGLMTERFSVSGALLVKLFGDARVEEERFAESAGQLRSVAVRIAMNIRFFMVSLTLLAALATALVYGLGGVWAIRGTLTIGTLTAMAGLLARLYAPLTQLTNLRVDIMTALVSFDRVFEVLDTKPAITDAPGAKEASGLGKVEFDHVSFGYPDTVTLASLEVTGSEDQAETEQVLHDVSFSVEPGRTLAIVGPSGAGKTTVTHLVARLYDVDSGAVRVGGDDVRDLTQASLRHSVGYVTQDAHMFHDTVRHNLLYAKPDATDAELWKALESARIDDLVRTCPTVLTPSSASAATASPAGNVNDWPSHDCC